MVGGYVFMLIYKKGRLGASGGLIAPPTPDHHPYIPSNLTDLIQNYYELHEHIQNYTEL